MNSNRIEETNLIDMKSWLAIALCVACFAVVGPIERLAARGSADITVDFLDCVESIGVGLVSTERARALVPAEFHLVGEGGPVTPVVVRSARCSSIAVADDRPKAGAIVQIGLVIVPPDFTGDINLYTLWYYTSDAKLAHGLTELGVRAQHVPTIVYGYEQSGDGSPSPFFVAVPRPGRPTLALDGTALESESPSGSFVANWWAKVADGSVKMSTSVPEIFVGAADLSLTTDANGLLGQLIDGGSAGFPVLQQFNSFPDARMTVSVNLP
jgi:hypothetical protein